MKLKEIFKPYLKNGTKTIELRKINKLSKLWDYNNYDDFCDFNNKGKFTICLENENGNELGLIVINGYKIVEKDKFYLWIETINQNQNDNKCLKNLTNEIYATNFIKKININIPIEIIQNYYWITENLDFIKNYFENEKEILILFIERYAEPNN